MAFAAMRPHLQGEARIIRPICTIGYAVWRTDIFGFGREIGLFYACFADTCLTEFYRGCSKSDVERAMCCNDWRQKVNMTSPVWNRTLPGCVMRVPASHRSGLSKLTLAICRMNSEFDAVGAFDVIEHISEDDVVLANIRRALKRGGVAIVTVPQHKWLWSATDELAMHKRRYTRRELSTKLVAAGLEILSCTSFVTVLLPAMYASRLTKRQRPKVTSESLYELEISRAANTVCSAAMRIDEALVGLGVSLPFGGSLLVAARKMS